ncbi:MAG: ABC transporter substrate-binding protein [Actinobacteria bacterium]|nr:ABC transporter substrate-binding protein [Actinomycetota bacterium]
MTRRRTIARGFAVAVVVTVLAAACGKNDNASKGTTTTKAGAGGSSTTSASNNDRGNIDGVLTLGTLLPESGDLSAIVKSLRTPVDMAVKEINDAGGVNGKQVQVASADDGTDPAKAATGFDRLVSSDKVDAILGPAASSVVKGVLDKVKSNGVVDCSGSATSAELTDLQNKGADGGYFFRTAPPDKLQGPALADLVSADNKTAVALLVRNDSYGTGFATALKNRFKANGIDVVANVAYDPAGTGTYDTDVQKVATAKPDAVVLIAFPDDGGKVLNSMIKNKIGPADVSVYTADGLQSSSFYQKVSATDPTVVKGMKGTAPSSAPSGVTSPFIAKFKATGVDPIFSSYYYDCTMLIALAAQSAKSDDPAKIKDEIPKVAAGGTKCNSFKACKDLLDKGTDIDFEGASGRVNLSAIGEPTVGSYDIWSFDAAGKVQTEPPDTQIQIDEKDL